MAMNKMMKYFILGGLLALGTSWLLGIISKFVSMIPGVNLDLQAISITTTGLGGVVDTGLSSYAQKAFGLIPVSLTLPEMLWAFVGGGLFVMLGAWLYDNVKMLQLGKTKAGKLATIFVLAGIVSGWILSMAVGIPAFTAIITMVVDAYILAMIIVWLDKTAKLNLIP